MADMKFSCPHCGQHISCGEVWAGIQTQCPACHNSIVVPQSQARAMPAPAPPTPKAAGPKLSAGVTQVARSSTPAPPSAMRSMSPPPRSDNSLLKYSLLFVVLAALGAAGYFYGLPLLTNTLQKETGAEPPATATTAPSGGNRGGPLGEVNEAMDASDALDGSSSAKPPARPATNNAARPRPAARR